MSQIWKSNMVWGDEALSTMAGERQIGDTKREILYVDNSSTSSTEDGTLKNPYKSLPTAFATISALSADWPRRVTVYVAPGAYGTSGSPVAIYVPAGRQINCIFMGPSSVNDAFVVRQDKSIAYSEPGNFVINGNINATQGLSGHWKEFSRSQSSLFSRPIYVINNQTSDSLNCHIQMCNIEFNYQIVVSEIGGASSSACGAYEFYGANFMQSYNYVGLWMSNVTIRYRDGFSGNQRTYIGTYGPSVRIMDAKNCLFGNQMNVKGIVRASCIFDGDVIVTEANNADATYDQPLKGLFRSKFKSMAGNVVNFNGPASSFYADRLTLKFSGGTNAVTFTGGSASLANAIGE